MRGLLAGSKPIAEFPVGKTTVGFTVTNNHHDSNTDYAAVISEDPLEYVVYCYYDEMSSSASTSLPGELSQGERPLFASNVSNIYYASAGEFQDSQKSKLFQTRSNFLVTGGKKTKVFITHIGAVRLLFDDLLFLDSDEPTKGPPHLRIKSYPVFNFQTVQVLYSRPSPSDVKLQHPAQGQKLKCNMSHILPVLTVVDLRSSQLGGRGTAAKYGVGLFNGVKIGFGNKQIEILVNLSTGDEVFVSMPACSKTDVVNITAPSTVGTSNGLAIQYSSSALPPILFLESCVRDSSNPIELRLINGIMYGPDQRYYHSAIDSPVYEFSVGHDMKAIDLCPLPSHGKRLSILGLAFNPADTDLRI
ncbi:unnamed protein product [Agarophyton chilense]